MSDIYYLVRSLGVKRTPTGCTLWETYRVHVALSVMDDPPWTHVVASLAELVRGRPGPWSILRWRRSATGLLPRVGEVVEYDGDDIADGILNFAGDLEQEVGLLDSSSGGR